jgi:hypothetical protein
VARRDTRSFSFENFEWTATVRETVKKVRAVWTYFVHVSLPNDSYVYSPEFLADETRLITAANNEAGQEVRALSNQVFQFIQRVTGKRITADVGRSIRTVYDTDENTARTMTMALPFSQRRS